MDESTRTVTVQIDESLSRTAIVEIEVPAEVPDHELDEEILLNALRDTDCAGTWHEFTNARELTIGDRVIAVVSSEE